MDQYKYKGILENILEPYAELAYHMETSSW